MSLGWEGGLVGRARRTRTQARTASAISQMLQAHSRLLQDEAEERMAAAAATQALNATLRRQFLGVGLVVANPLDSRRRLRRALAQRLPSVLTAGESASALGLAMVEQPDVVVIDDSLPTISGLDTSHLIRSYVPDSRIVLFTDDQRALETAGRHEIATSRRDLSWRHVLTTIDGVITG